MSEKGMTMLSKGGLLGNEGMGKLVFCNHCIFRKQKKVSFSIALHHTKGALDYIHSDLWAPFKVPLFGEKRYMLLYR